MRPKTILPQERARGAKSAIPCWPTLVLTGRTPKPVHLDETGWFADDEHELGLKPSRLDIPAPSLNGYTPLAGFLAAPLTAKAA